ncbi:sugar phosphate isomerase/epimerase family protein [Paenibacillus sp. GCM10012307]|uniref:Sugar phosphate isomerase/epimerase n=1 Tax=Paenibacillus roseus TaxID=2798579 RepID=A0A934IWJ5_9BACL|nr:sugar phosphate isomerase/epimerase [Paenibacillus roseus]MBJ6360616.1 sugar phosphate isomerase/epimerase [Paenibacillus roseus]
MKSGVFTVLFGQSPLEQALDKIQEAGLQAVELGTGGYPGNTHCNPGVLLDNQQELVRLKESIEQRGLEISALSCHGNPLHPNKEVAQQHHNDFVQTVRLAEALGVETVVTFSGCPGDSEHAKYPSWSTCAWPPDFLEVSAWQWSEKVLPYWREQSDFCRQHGVRVAIEAHPGFVVYNTETALRLRAETGSNIGVNFDPSHLYWQGMDPVECIKQLGSTIYHVHAKDTSIDKRNTALNGVLDLKPYDQELDRSWIFRTIGYGHGLQEWQDIISALTKVGYDGVISIEHEDGLMSVDEGFQKAARFLNQALIREKAGEMWWA